MGLSRLNIAKWSREPLRFWRPPRFPSLKPPARAPSLCLLSADLAGSSIHLGSQTRVEPPPSLLAPLVHRWTRKATESIEFIKGRWAISSPGASEGTRSRRGRPCQLEEWNYAWMNHWTVQREWGGIDCVVPAGSPSESRKVASAIVLTVTKRRKESQLKVGKKRHESVKCD